MADHERQRRRPGPRHLTGGLAVGGALFAFEASLCRITGGSPPAIADLAAGAALAAILGLAWAMAPVGPTARVLVRALPATVVGLGMLLPPLLGTDDLVRVPALVLLVAAVVVLAPTWFGAAPPLGPRAQIALVATTGLPAWIVTIGEEQQLPPGPMVAAVLGLLVAALLLGRWAVVLAIAALVPSTAEERWTASGPVSSGPDLVLITIDTLRLDAAARMESLAWLARRGARLEAQAAAPWTLPSIATLHTGLHPARHGAGRTSDGFAPLSPEVSTLAERLSAAGWDTAATAENPFTGPVFGLDRGFARFRHQSARPWVLPRAPHAPDARPLGATIAAAIGLLEPSPVGVARRLRDARELLAARRDRPVFLWVHVLDPHLPYTHAWGLAETPLPTRWWLAHANRTRIGEDPDADTLAVLRRAYAHEVRQVDAALSSFLRELEAGPRDRVVVVTSDHGEAFGEHGGWEHGHTMHQELLAVPLVVSGVEVGTSGPVGHVDVAPTLLAAAGLSVDGLDGRALSDGGSAALPSVNPMYGDPSLRALRLPGPGPDKAIADDLGARAYDLDADPAEQHPIELSDALWAALPEAFDGAGAAELDERTTEALRALGYLE